MFDLGTQELIVIFIVAFLVFGPEKLPELGRTLGKGIRDLKSAMRGVQNSFDETGADLTKEMKGLKNDMEDSIYKSIDSNINEEKGKKEEIKQKKENSQKDENMSLFDEKGDGEAAEKKGAEKEEEEKEEVKEETGKETDKDG